MLHDPLEDLTLPARQRQAPPRYLLAVGVAGAVALGVGAGLWARPAESERRLAPVQAAAPQPAPRPVRQLEIVLDDTPAPIGAPIEVLPAFDGEPLQDLPPAPVEPTPLAPVRPPAGLVRVQAVEPVEPIEADPPAPKGPSAAELKKAELKKAEARKAEARKAERAVKAERAEAKLKLAKLEKAKAAKLETAKLEKAKLEKAKLEKAKLAKLENAKAKAEPKTSDRKLAKKDEPKAKAAKSGKSKIELAKAEKAKSKAEKAKLAKLASAERAAREAESAELKKQRRLVARLESALAKAITHKARDAQLAAKSEPKAKVVKPKVEKAAAKRAPKPERPKVDRDAGPLRKVSNTNRCVSADPGAALVCADPSLGAVDRQMTRAYREAEAAGVPAWRLRQQHERWLAARSAAAREAPWAVQDVYSARIAELRDQANDAGASY